MTTQLAILLRMPVRQGLAGLVPDFQRAADALAVVGGEALRGGGIDLAQASVERRPAVAQRFLFDLGADGGIGGRHVVQALEQGLEVEHGAADQQGQVATRLDRLHGGAGVLHEACCAVALQGIDQVDQVVRGYGQFFRRRLGGADVHLAVDQGGIDTDDFHRQLPVLVCVLGQRQRCGGLATGGGAGNRQIAGEAGIGHGQRPRRNRASSSRMPS